MKFPILPDNFTNWDFNIICWLEGELLCEIYPGQFLQILSQGLGKKFSVKDQIENIFSSVSHTVHVTATQLGP